MLGFRTKMTARPSSDAPAPPPSADAPDVPLTQLREDHDRLKATLEALPDILFVVDRGGRIYDFHTPHPELLYVPPAQFLGRKMGDLLPEPAAGVIRAAIEETVAKGHHQGSVYPLATSAGERWFEISAAAQGDLQTPAGRLVFLARDVTDRQEAEAELEDAHAWLKATLQALPDILFVVDRDGRVLDYHSPRAEMMLIPPEQFLGKTIPDLVCESSAKILRDALRKAAEEGPQEGVVFSIPLPDGERWYEASIAAQGDPRSPDARFVAIVRDVHDRKQAEQALRESEERFSESARQSRTYLWEVDADGLYTFVSPVVRDVLGYRPEEIVGRLHFYDLFPERDRAALKNEIFEVIRRRGSFRDYENLCQAKNGHGVWMITSAVPRLDADGALRGYRGSDTDVTPRKLAEEQLRESEERLAQSAQQSRTVIWEVDADGLFTFVSPVVEDVLGYRPEDIVGKLYFYDLFPERDRAAFKQEIFEVIRRRQAFRDYENVCQAKDGRDVWVITSAIPLLDADGALRGYRGSDTDITPRKQAEERLRESEARFAQSAQQSRTVIWEVDADGLFTFVSPVVEDVLGYRPEELVGQLHFYDLYPEEKRAALQAAVGDVFRRREAFRNFESRGQAKDGQPVWVVTNAIPLLNDDGTLRGYRGGNMDVTARKRAEEALRESEQKYRMLTEGMKDVVWVLDVEEQRFLYVSPSVEELRGYTPAEILAQPLEAAWLPAERERLFALLQGYVADFLAGKIDENTYVPIEFSQPCKNGSTVPSEAICRLVRNERNGRLELHGVTRDISRRVQAESAFRESETRFNNVAQTSRSYAWEIDASGLLTYVSPVVEDVLGYRPEEIVGRMHFYDFQPAECQAEAKTAALQLFHQAQPIANFENSNRTKDGHLVWLSSSATPLFRADGSLRGYQGVDIDITARKQAEEALRESEARLRTLNDNLPGGLVYQMDTGVDGRERRLLAVSKGVERMHGVTAEDALSHQKTFYLQIVPEDQAKVAELETRAIATLTPFRAEVRCRLPSGEIRWIYVSSAPRRMPNGHLVWDGIELDIHERKQAEEALRASEAKYRLLHETMRDAFASADMEGHVLETNPAFRDLLGYSEAELRGRDYRKLTPVKWHAAEAKILAEQVLARGYSDVYQKEYLRKDGTTVPVELRTILIRDEAGRPAGMWASIRDVAARLRIEQALRQATGELERRVRERTAELEASRQALAQSEAQFRQMTGIIQEVFWLVDAHTGRALYVSPAFEQIWGRPPRKDNPGVFTWVDGLHPEDRERALQAFTRGLEAGAFDPLEVRGVRPDGSIRWIEVRGWLIRAADGEPPRVAGVMRDITERRRLEAEILTASETERQRIGRDLHDSLGQSLTGIGYLAEALREELARNGRPEAAEVETLAHLIEEAAGKSHAMARGLLLVDLKRGGLAPALQELAFRTQEMFGVACRYEGLADVELPDADVAGQLYRIAQEAATNAAKHSQGKIIAIGLANPPEGLLLSIRDTGKGLPLRKKKKAGMGLEIMRYRARMIGATLWIDSAPNRGTIVNCRLPRAAPPQETTP